MNSDCRYWGCAGRDCPKQDRCARALEQGSADRPHTFQSAPYNHYSDGITQEFRCGYYEKPKEES